MLHPASLFARDAEGEQEAGADKVQANLSYATLVRCVAHVVARESSGTGESLADDPRKSAYVVASFFKKRETPSLKECAGIIKYDMIDVEKVNKVAQEKGEEFTNKINDIAKTVSQLIAFHADDFVKILPDGSFHFLNKGEAIFHEKKVAARARKAEEAAAAVEAGEPAPDQSSAHPARPIPVVKRGYELLEELVEAGKSLLGPEVDVPLEVSAGQAWERLSSLPRPAPIYFALSPTAGSDQAAVKLRNWMKDTLQVDIPAGFDISPMRDIHVALMYLGKHTPKEEDAERKAMYQQLCDLVGVPVHVRVVRIAMSDQIVCAEVEITSDKTIPSANKHPNVTIALRGKYEGKPTRPVHSFSLLEAVASGSTTGDVNGFTNVKVIDAPVNGEQCVLETTVRAIHATR
jgi:hypothetical protein